MRRALFFCGVFLGVVAEVLLWFGSACMPTRRYLSVGQDERLLGYVLGADR
jgi:hypothetical protein